MTQLADDQSVVQRILDHIDNETTDPIFVVGAEDQTPPTGPQTVLVSVRAWDFSPGGPVSAPLTLEAGTAYTPSAASESLIASKSGVPRNCMNRATLSRSFSYSGTAFAGS